MDIGSDISGVSDLDWGLTVVDGRRALAEAIARRWLAPRGSLFYDADYGGGLIEALSGPVDDVAALGRRLEDEALKDERVRSARVEIERRVETLYVTGRLIDAEGRALRLTADVGALTVTVLLED